jgi:hypothetical protein
MCWVGESERPEFVRQNDLLVSAWTKHGATISGHHAKGLHHFNVIDDLAIAQSAMCGLFAP